MKIFDQHVHSYYSFDCEERIEKFLDAAEKYNLAYFILTDHYDFNFLDKGKDNDFSIIDRRKELDILQKQYPHIQILDGIEIGYKKSEEERILSTIHSHHFDLINLSVHDLNSIDYFFPEYFTNSNIKDILNDYYAAQLEMVERFDDFDVLCHIDYAFKTAYKCDNSITIKDYEEYLIKIMQTLIKKDKSFELNIKVQDCLPIEHTKYLLSLYKKIGGKNLTLSSDAHTVDKYYANFDKYIQLIKEAGFTYLIYYINREKHIYYL